MATSRSKTVTLLAVFATFLVCLVIIVVVLTGAFSDSHAPASFPPPTQAPVMLTSAPTLSPTTQADCNFPLGVEIRDGDDYIGIIFTGCPSIDAFIAFTTAADRWSSIIKTNKILPCDLGSSFNVSEFCGFLQPFQVEGVGVLDHLLIIVETVEIDGPGNILASAGPCLVDNSESLVPIFGGMRFDNADLARLEERGGLQDVVLHEMGHVLGISRVFFEAIKQGGGPASTPKEGMLRDPMYDENGVGTPGNVPKFLGNTSTEFYSNLTGQFEPFVPLEDGTTGGVLVFNVSLGEGRGSVDSHFDKDAFDNELMTFSINLDDDSHPLSGITVGALADLGYDVDLNLADPYQLPSGTGSVSKFLIGNRISLENDVPDGWDISQVMTVEEAMAKRNSSP